MAELNELEGLIRNTLVQQASRITPAPGYTQRIKDQLRLQQQAQRGDTLSWRRTRPIFRQAAVVACCAVLVLTLIFVASEPARTWATDTFLKVFKIDRTPYGFQITPTDPSSPGAITIDGRLTGTVPIPITPDGRSTTVIVTSNPTAPADAIFKTPEDLRAKIGLAFYLPSYLPEGYQLSVMSAQQPTNKVNGKEVAYKVANAVFTSEGKGQLEMYVTDYKDFLIDASDSQVVALRGQTGRWSDYPVVTYDATSQTVSVGHQLRWEENGTYYVLTNNSADLTLDEMVRIAESISIE